MDEEYVYVRCDCCADVVVLCSSVALEETTVVCRATCEEEMSWVDRPYRRTLELLWHLEHLPPLPP